jgi:hypothetical protein
VPRGGATPLDQLDRYNVVWHTPNHDASGSMPIGNGEVGLNAWVEEDGSLLVRPGSCESLAGAAISFPSRNPPP